MLCDGIGRFCWQSTIVVAEQHVRLPGDDLNASNHERYGAKQLEQAVLRIHLGLVEEHERADYREDHHGHLVDGDDFDLLVVRDGIVEEWELKERRAERDDEADRGYPDVVWFKFA